MTHEEEHPLTHIKPYIRYDITINPTNNTFSHEESVQWHVDRIISGPVKKTEETSGETTLWFLVRWKNFSAQADSYVKERDLRKTAPQVLNEYLLSKKRETPTTL